MKKKAELSYRGLLCIEEHRERTDGTEAPGL